MKRLTDATRRSLALLPALLIAVVLTIAVVPASVEGSGPRWPTTIVFGAGVVAVVATIAAKLAGHDPEADRIATRLSSDELGQALIGRWLRRSRYYRGLGGMTGSVLGIAASATEGVGGSSALFAVGGLAGVALGGALAEIHVLRPQRAGSVVAELSVRRLDDYVGRGLLRLSLGVAGAAALISLLALLVANDPAGILRWSLPALLIVGAVVALQHHVAVRRRPAVSSALREADDLLRYLAATRGFAPPALALSLGLCGSAIGTLSTSQVADVVSAVFWIAAIVCFLLNTGHGLDVLVRRTPAPRPSPAS